MALIVLSFFISSAIFIFLYYSFMEEDIKTRRRGKSEGYGYIVALLAAFALRVIIAPLIEGYPNDMSCWLSWSSRMATVGPFNFYDATGGYFCDYPPGYMYFLWPVGLINKLFSGLGRGASIAFAKQPAIIFDILIGLWIYRFAKEKTGKPMTSLILSIFYLFNPATILNSAVWGQIDSVLTFFLVASIFLLAEEKYYKSAILYTLAILIKPQALMFAPIFLFALIEKIAADKDYKKWLAVFGKAVGLALLTFIVVSLPFAISQKPFWLFDLYFKTLSSYPYATLNAYNFFALIKGNFAPLSGKFIMLPYSVWGYSFMLAGIILCARLFLKGGDKSKYYYLSALMMSIFFTFGAKMHERYLFPVILLYILAYIIRHDGRILLIGGLFSAHHFLNTGIVLKDMLGGNPFTPADDPFMLVLALVAVVLTIYAVYVGYKLYMPREKNIRRKKIPISALSRGKSGKMSGLDWLLLSALTVFYFSAALPNLGVNKAPSAGVLITPEKSITFDFGKTTEFSKLTYFKDIEKGDLIFKTSADGRTWEEGPTVSVNECFTWYTKRDKITARFLNLTSTEPILVYELAFFEGDNAEPTTPVAGGGALFDEQNTVPSHPSYKNGMYFDEIYHARTAREHINFVEPYENTHPPLGKLIISAGILLFGMNPFGWRIAGMVFGALMVPLMYLFGKRLFKSTPLAFAAAFFMAFDFMHFSQTRIATIDTFVVFFIILMYYFMYRYYELDLAKTSLGKSLVPLAFSGLFMGLGIASKWTGIYAGLGLAVLLFISLYKRQAKTKDAGFTIKTLAWCLLFFVAVPIAIYAASYIPIIKAPGNTIKDIWGYQKHMYSYHAGLDATHPFSSPWYQWPIIKRPVWFYASDSADMAEGMVSSIVTMGNPALWWAGAVSMLLSFYYAFKLKDERLTFLVIALLSQYLPWMMVNRVVFIYHFFTSVPFMFFMLAYWVGVYMERPVLAAGGGKSLAEVGRGRLYLVGGYFVLAAVLFFMFFPVLSGAPVAREYVNDYLKWIPSWVLSN